MGRRGIRSERVGHRVLWSALFLAVWCLAQGSASGPRPVYVAEITGMIDLGLGPFTERVLQEAEAEGAPLVVFEIDTLGGRVDAAITIRDHLLGSRVPTVAFVRPRAISAGALIALAAERIAMKPGGTLGAATPVQLGAEGASPVDEKAVSYVRKEFRATADARKRPGPIAEAMVDPDVVVPGLSAKGKLLTLTTSEALAHGVADLEATDLQELLEKLELDRAPRRRAEVNWAERVLRFLTQPVVASLLLTIGFLGLLIELQTPGVGLPGVLGVLCLVAFFGGHAIVKLVGWEQVLLVVLGLALLALEIFVLPGFGVAGVLGLVALGAGLTTSLLGAGATPEAILLAVARVAISATLALLGAWIALRFLPRVPGGRKLILSTTVGEASGTEEAEPLSFVGARGTSITPLRPAGIALLAGERVDVVSQGEFIAPGEPIEVVTHEGHRVVVRRAPSPSDGTSSKGEPGTGAPSDETPDAPSDGNA